MSAKAYKNRKRGRHLIRIATPSPSEDFERFNSQECSERVDLEVAPPKLDGGRVRQLLWSKTSKGKRSLRHNKRGFKPLSVMQKRTKHEGQVKKFSGDPKSKQSFVKRGLNKLFGRGK